MWSFITEQIRIISASGWLFKKKITYTLGQFYFILNTFKV